MEDWDYTKHHRAKRKTKHNKVGFISKMSSRVAGRSRYSRSRSRSPRYTRRYSRSRSRSGSPRGGPSGGGGASRYGGRPGPSREDRRGRSHRYKQRKIKSTSNFGSIFEPNSLQMMHNF